MAVQTNEVSGAAGRPAVLAALTPERIVDVDVRDDLRTGREPFRRIMAAQASLEPGAALRLRAIFEPVPLYDVMAARGLDHWSERLAADDWVIWFYPAAGQPAGAQGAAREVAAPDSGAAPGAAADVVVLDVRGLEPPEPMIRTLERLETLPAGVTLVQINERVPQFLLPQLKSRGFAYEIRRQDDELVRVFIRRADD